jgi:hypothetical protein
MRWRWAHLHRRRVRWLGCNARDIHSLRSTSNKNGALAMKPILLGKSFNCGLSFSKL